MYLLNSIQVHRFPFYIHPGHVSNPSRSPRLTYHIPPGRILPQSSSRYLYLISTQMTSHLHPCLRILVSPPSRYRLTSIQGQKLFSYHDPYRSSHLSRSHLTQNPGRNMSFTSIHTLPYLHLSPYIHISPSSRLCLTSIQVPAFASHLHPDDVSTPPRSRKLHLCSIQVTSKTNPGI